MLRFFPLETFKEISFEGKLLLRYAISNYGRLVSFTDKIEDGRFVKGSLQDGYKIFRYKTRDADNNIKHKHSFFYKLVAEQFLPKTSDDQVFVLHLDRNRANDYVGNLKWATKTEMLEHSKKSPYVIEAKRKLVEHRIKSDGNKLTETQVIFLKKKLLDPNRKTRMKILAKQFGVSEMTLHRIKTGENWGHIKV
ncbi:MAG: NUMOD4 domain-containing protein [Flavobacterium sp.]